MTAARLAPLISILPPQAKSPVWGLDLGFVTKDGLVRCRLQCLEPIMLRAGIGRCCRA